jgi:hypothetical protein
MNPQTPDRSADILRRQAVCGGLAAVGLLPAGAAFGSQRAAAEGPSRLRLEDQALAFRKLAFATNADPGFWWLQGRRYGLVDNQLTPLWDMHVGVVFRTRDLAGGRYEVRSIAASFYTDLESGAFLRTFKNPYTGVDTPVFYYPPSPTRVRYSGLAVEGNAAPAGLNVKDDIGRPRIDGEALTIRSDHLVSGVLSGKAVRVNDMSTYIGVLNDIRDAAVSMAPASQTFNDFNSWPDWLLMGDRPGTYLSRAYGRKAFALGEMPATWRRLLKETHPEIADDPVRALGA